MIAKCGLNYFVCFFSEKKKERKKTETKAKKDCLCFGRQNSDFIDAMKYTKRAQGLATTNIKSEINT